MQLPAFHGPACGGLPLELPPSLMRGALRLRLPVAGLERDFRRDYAERNARRVQIGLGAGIALFLVFAFWDTLSFPPELLRLTLWIRLGFAAPLLAVGVLATLSARTRPLLPAFVAPGAVAAGLGVVAIVALARAHGQAVDHDGVFLATIAAWSLTGLRTLPAAALAAAIFGAHLLGEVWLGSPPGRMAETVVFLLTANLMGGIDSLSRERAARLEFLRVRQLRDLASRDGLTGLWNRRALDEQLAGLVRQARRDEVPIAVLLLDVDHFKSYNDVHGHLEGDRCLRLVGGVLARVVLRPLDVVARYGGEEFALVAFDTSPEGALVLARRVHDAVAAIALPHPASPLAQHVTVSVGVAAGIPEPGEDAVALLARADEALYAAKRAGRNRTQLAAPPKPPAALEPAEVGEPVAGC